MKLFLNSACQELQDKHLKNGGEILGNKIFGKEERIHFIPKNSGTQITSIEYNNQLKVGSMCVG